LDFLTAKEMDYSNILQEVYEKVSKEEGRGGVASYIPELAKVDPLKFGVFFKEINGRDFGMGDFDEKFSIQSIAKVASLCLAYKMLGEKIWERMGVEPSGTPFNSLVQLESDRGVPRNPFINAGAIVICDILIGELNNPEEDLLSFMREISDNSSISFSENIAESEKSTGYRNVALCNFIKSFGNIENSPEKVIDFYFKLCSIEMSCREISCAFLFLANGGRKISDNKQILSESQTKRTNAIMQSCGLYDESGEFTFKVGLPGKSGVGGGILAIHPYKYAVTLWSPKLNSKGNSYKGMRFLELFTTKARSSIF